MKRGSEIKVLDHGYVKLIDYMGSDEAVIEAARMSTNKGFQNWGEDIKLLEYLYKNAHMTPFECGGEMIIEVQAPIMVFREWHRHRTQCLDGDTYVYFEKPASIRKRQHRGCHKIKIKDLYNRWQQHPRKERPERQTKDQALYQRNVIKGMRLRCLNEDTNEFITTSINDVIYSGKKEMFRITLSDGKTIDCSKDHKFIFENGWQSFGEAVSLQNVNGKAVYNNVSVKIKVNGTEPYKDIDWLKDKYHNQNMRLYEIAKKYTINYNTLRKWIAYFGLQKQNSFKKGNVPWNKGKTYKTGRIIPDWHKEIIRAARSGLKSNFWKGGVTKDRANIGVWTTKNAHDVHRKFNFTCQLCGCKRKLQAHHIIPVWLDETKAYVFDNLISLCKSCHKEVHKDEVKHIKQLTGKTIDKHNYSNKIAEIKTKRSKAKLLVGKFVSVKKIEFLGIKDCYDLSVDDPYHNFVANGIVTHNSYNELSARYTQMPNIHYLPVKDRIKKQSKSNKQGSSDEDPFDDVFKLSLLEDIQDTQRIIYDDYQEYINKGVAREIARINTPVSRYSRMRAKTDLRNWLAFLNLRMRENAQWEIRQYANAVAEIVKQIWPRTYSCFEEYDLYGARISRTEIMLLQKFIDEFCDVMPYFAFEEIGKRTSQERFAESLLKKLGVEDKRNSERNKQ